MAKKNTTANPVPSDGWDVVEKGAGNGWFPHCERTEELLHRTAYEGFTDEPPEFMPPAYYERHERGPQPNGRPQPQLVTYTLTEAGKAAQAAAHARRDQVLEQ